MITVTTPTVQQRRHSRELTLCQWRALGIRPILVEQDPALPLGHASQTLTALRAVREGLHSGADIILYAEDDINLDPQVLNALAAWDRQAPLSLWHRPRFRPAGAKDSTIVQALNSAHWYSSLAIALTRPMAQHLTAQPAGARGIDIMLRTLPPMQITVPVLVEHRHLPRVASKAGGIDSGNPNPQIPDIDQLAHQLWEWLPARRSKRRPTDPIIAANALNIPDRLTLALYDGMRHAGHIIPDPSGYHQGTKPAAHTAPPEVEIIQETLC
jgi:hypothetical protein